MGQESKEMTPIQQAAEFIKRAEPKFDHAPPGIVFDAEQSFAIQHLTNNDYLLKAAQESPESLLAAMSNVANIGLSLNPAKAQAFLIPRSVCIGKQNGQKIYKLKVFLDPSYRGLCDIATGSGCVSWIQAEVVREGDTFILNGVDKPPTHERNPFDTDRKVIGAYCVAKLPPDENGNSDYLTTTMSIAELDKIKETSETGKKGYGPWKDWPEEQQKKSVVRRAWKMWPKSKEFDRVADAIELSNENEGFEPIVNSPSLKFTPEQKKHFDYLLEKGDGIGLHCFLTGIDESAQTALFNSFEKGTVTKNKELVRKLQGQGYSLLVDIETTVGEAMSSGDDMAAKEVLEGLSQEATDFIVNRNDDEFGAYVRNLLQEMAA